jgi:RNA polymerase sigma-70 factor, ECF subfamily
MPNINKSIEKDNRESMSFEDIYTDTWESLYRFIYYKVQNREEAEDIIQDTYVKAISYIQKGKVNPDKYINFLKTVAMNVLRDLWRKNNRRGNVVNIDFINPMDTAIDDPTENSTKRMLIEEALIELNEEQRTVIELRIIKGYSSAETAKLMNRKEGTIRVMQHRALQSLASILKNKE